MSGDLMIKYNQMFVRSIVIVLSVFAIFSCKNSSDISNTKSRPGKNEMADLNRFLVQKDKERIQNYIERKNLKMTESPTGLWYQIVSEGAGVNYTILSVHFLTAQNAIHQKNLDQKKLLWEKAKWNLG
jgi:hypothetical protein